MRKYLVFLCTVFFIGTQAQSFDFEGYTWEEKIEPYKPTEIEKDLPEVGLKSKYVIELVVEGESGLMYSLAHTIKFLNSQEALERNNKIYLPLNIDGSVEKQIARVVNPKGDVIELDQDDILEAEDETTGRKYKYFALEGLEVGSTMEYISVTKYYPSLSGASFNLQSTYLKKDVSFDVFYPDHLVFEFKSYHGFPEMEEDTTAEDVTHFMASVKELKALKDEPYQNYNANQQSVSYKLTGNHYSRNYNINSFSTFASNIHEVMYPELDKKESKIIAKFLEAAKVDYARSEEDKIRKVEDYIKEAIVYVDEGANVPSTITGIEAQKAASEFGLFLVYAQMFKALGIKVEFVGTCNRFTNIFDKDFENMKHMSEFAFYFPKYDKYLAPTQTFHRYPFIPYQWTANYGYFVKTVELGGVSMGSGKAKYIEPMAMEESKDTLSIFIDFSEGLNEPKYEYFRAYTGLDAVFNQTIFTYLTGDEDKEEFREELIMTLDESMEIENLQTKNEGAEFLGKKPYEMTCTFTTESFIEKAGPNYLLKIGELIGPQQEMYEDKERQSDIEFSFAKVYMRTISFEIPEGYALKNLEKCAEDLEYTDENGKVLMGFKTTYTQEGNVVTISNTEYYDEIRMAADPYYEPFRKVINAAADFNKIVLVLEG